MPNLCSLEPKGGLNVVAYFDVNDEKDLVDMLPFFFEVERSLPADWSGLRKILAADLVGTAPLRLLRSTLCSLPGTEGQAATPMRLC